MSADGVFTRSWVERFAASVAATEAELTALDQRAGDGDFGVNMLGGLTAMTDVLGTEPPGGTPPDAAEPLEALSGIFLDQVGGTSGPLFGLLFQELTVAAQRTAPALTTEALADGTESGLAAIQRVGEAVPGDKTLVDALHPATQALRRAAGENAPVDEALRAAARQAWEGVYATTRLRARQGRASYLGERASGVPDPGAVGVAILFSSANGELTSLAPYLAEAEAGSAG